MPSSSPRPTGTITFLFTDIEGSTALVQRFGEAWPELLERHRRALRAAFAAHGGIEQGTEGDSFFVVFASASDAVAAAVAAQRALSAEDWPVDGEVRVRMGLHTGEGRLSGGDYVGLDVHRAARIGAAGHGGQVLLSEATATLVRERLPTGVGLADLGEHRLKDLPRPERIEQLSIEGLPSDFPTLRTLGARASNVPVALSSFLGREADVRAVRSRLADGSRFITVTGAGGTGKTRLVQEVARRVADDFGGGVTFVPLDAIRDGELIPVEILRALRLDSASPAPPVDRLVDALGDRETLLVLDNLEQASGAGPVVRQLLGALPRLWILASSQAALRIEGEQEYPLQPLDDAAAIQLFVDRARAAQPDFTIDAGNRAAIAAICERLDGLPLAIELAAAQARFLPPAAILGRISDRIDSVASRQPDLPPRQRTLRGAVTWSYDLLDEPERALFRRLSVFVGGATIADLEAFEARRGRAMEALSTLEGLVERSLVSVRRVSAEEHRFVQLQTVRTVARDLLRGEGEEAEALDDHAAVFEALATEAEPELYGRDRRAWLDRLAAEHPNLRAALDHLEASGDLAAALGIAASIWRFWQTRGHLIEARSRLEHLLQLASTRSDLSPLLLSRAEEAAGGVAYWMRSGGDDQIEPHYLRSLELALASGDRNREAWARYNLAFVYDFVAIAIPGKYDREHGAQLRNEALELFRATGDRRGIGESLWALGGNAVALREDPDLARVQLQEAAAILREIGDNYGASWAMASLGFIGLSTGQPEDAEKPFLESARIFLADDDMTGQLLSIQALGALAMLSGDEASAVRFDAVAMRLAREIGLVLPEIDPIVERIRQARARLAPDAIAREERAAETAEARPFLEAALAEREANRAGRDAHLANLERSASAPDGGSG